MSHIINRVLGKTIGVNLTRTRPRKVIRAIGNPSFVEFVGASGVGKTTLYKNTFDKVKDKWLHITEFRRMLNQYIDGKTTESLSGYQELAQYKIQSILSSNYTGIDQMNLIKYFHSVLVDDSLVYLFNDNYNVISEDGLIHNFSDCLSALSKSSKEALESMVKHRAIIYCHTSAEIAANRIIEREEKTGQLRPQHKVISFDDLMLLQQKTLENYHQIIDYLSKYDIPILSVDTSDSIDQNVDQVVQFLNELTNSR